MKLIQLQIPLIFVSNFTIYFPIFQNFASYIAFTLSLSLTQSQGDIAAQYEEVMKKVQTLNVISDSNRLLRDERDQLSKQVRLEYVYKNYTCTCIITKRMQDIVG